MKILVTAGPTREPIDPVRFISNRSSGKMGYAVARAGAARGHTVVLVSGPVHRVPPKRVRCIHVVTAAEMLVAVKRNLAGCDALVMAAAVADWRSRQVALRKIKKGRRTLRLDLVRTEDILQSVVSRRDKRVWVGFAAETDHLLAEARRKLKDKKLDLIVANDVTRSDSGFDVDTNKVTFLSGDGMVEELPVMTKDRVAQRIIRWIERKAEQRS